MYPVPAEVELAERPHDGEGRIDRRRRDLVAAQVEYLEVRRESREIARDGGQQIQAEVEFTKAERRWCRAADGRRVKSAAICLMMLETCDISIGFSSVFSFAPARAVHNVCCAYMYTHYACEK